MDRPILFYRQTSYFIGFFSTYQVYKNVNNHIFKVPHHILK
jgi:hypothetical protein